MSRRKDCSWKESSPYIWWRLLQFLELGHRNLVAEMPLEQLVGDESFWSVALRIDKGDVVIDLADSLQLIGMAMVVRASIDTNQEDCDMDPREAEEIEFEFVHVSRFAIE